MYTFILSKIYSASEYKVKISITFIQEFLFYKMENIFKISGIHFKFKCYYYFFFLIIQEYLNKMYG